ncbi:MAG TPA: tetratricopeptide repeat protein [Pyrinomonadaceae bacterium]|nr:tetratricopeptide repeat protein [Pyrinomonadaceae bacterium]
MKTPECPRARTFRAALLSLVALFALGAASCSNPEKAKAEHVSRGETFLKERRYQEAVIEFRNAVQVDDQMAAAHWGLAQAYEALGRAGEYIEELQRTVKLDPSNVSARLKLANAYLAAYDRNKNQEFLAQAEQLAGEILARDDRNPDGHVLLGNILFFKDPTDAGRRAAEEKIRHAISLDPQRVESHVGLARFFLLSGSVEKAEAAYRQAVSVNERSSLAHVEYGRFLIQARRLNEAEAELLKATEVDPENRDVRFFLASFYLVNMPAKAEAAYTAWARLDWERPEGRARLADYYATVGRYDEAANLYREIIASAPDYARGRYRLGEISLQRGDVAGASEQAEELRKVNERDADMLFLRGRVRLASGKLKEALGDFKSVLDQDPRSRLGLYFMAEALYRDGQFEQARTRAAELERFHPDFLPGKLLQIQISFDGGDADAARKLADDLLRRLDTTAPGGEQTPQLLAEVRTNALLLRGKAGLRAGQTAAARADIERARESAPNSPLIHVNLADVAFAEGKREEAWQHVERALAADRANFQALSALINLAVADRRLDQARERLEQLSAEQPNNAGLHYLRGQAYSLFNDAQGADAARAEEALRRAVQADPDYVAAYSALAALYFNRQQPDRAIAEYSEVTRRRPDDFTAVLRIGLIEAQRNNREAAADYYRRVLAIRPDEPVASNNLAMLYADYGLGNPDEAMRLAQEVVRRFPNEPGFADTLGWVYQRRGMHTAAVEQLQRAVAGAVKGGKDNSLYRWHFGAALAAKGDKPAARRELQKSLDLIRQEQSRPAHQRPPASADEGEVRRTMESL